MILLFLKVQLVLFEYILEIIIQGYYSQVFGVVIQYLIPNTRVYFFNLRKVFLKLYILTFVLFPFTNFLL